MVKARQGQATSTARCPDLPCCAAEPRAPSPRQGFRGSPPPPSGGNQGCHEIRRRKPPRFDAPPWRACPDRSGSERSQPDSNRLPPAGAANPALPTGLSLRGSQLTPPPTRRSPRPYRSKAPGGEGDGDSSRTSASTSSRGTGGGGEKARRTEPRSSSTGESRFAARGPRLVWRRPGRLNRRKNFFRAKPDPDAVFLRRAAEDMDPRHRGVTGDIEGARAIRGAVRYNSAGFCGDIPIRLVEVPPGAFPTRNEPVLVASPVALNP